MPRGWSFKRGCNEGWTLYTGLTDMKFVSIKRYGTERWSLHTGLGAEGLVFLERLSQGVVSLYRSDWCGIGL